MDSNIFKTKYGKTLGYYGNTLDASMRRVGPDFLDPTFLTPALQQVGRQTQQGIRSLRDAGGNTLGFNQGGAVPFAEANIYQSAPVGAATIAAKNASFGRFNEMARGVMGLKDLQRGWFDTVEGMKLAKDALAQQGALAMGGSGGGWMDLAQLGVAAGGAGAGWMGAK